MAKDFACGVPPAPVFSSQGNVMNVSFDGQRDVAVPLSSYADVIALAIIALVLGVLRAGGACVL